MSPTPTPTRTPKPPLAVRPLRAAGSATVLAVLLLGVPLVLAVAGSLPAGIPTGGDVIDALTQPDDGHVLLAVLTIVAWALWAWFALSLIVEIPQTLRRRPHQQRRSLGAPQRLAAFLLGALLLAPAGTAMAASAPAHAASAPHQVAPSASPRSQQDSTTTDRAPAGPVHVVGETGETVWDIAVEFLGSGQRAAEIRTLNPHLPDSAMLPAGLSVHLPADATPPAPDEPEPAANAEAGGESPQVQMVTTATLAGQPYTVHSGDSLSSVADKELGSADAWPALFAANKGKTQPHGLPSITEPDLIYPGQHITVPGHHNASPPAAQHDEHQPSDAKKPGRTGGTTGPAPAHPHTAPSPSVPVPSQAPAVPSSQSPTPQRTAPARTKAPTTQSTDTATPAVPADQHASDQATSSVDVREVAGAFALLAAAITGALTVRRILQRRRRRPGETIAIAQETSPAEAQLAQAADPDGATRLDLALRTLAHHTTEANGTLPAVEAARITRHGVSIYLPQNSDASPGAPFVKSSDGWWDQDGDTELLTEQTAHDVPAPYPALTTVGATPEGHLLLLNVTQQPTILLDGDRDEVEAVCASLALELAMAPWASSVEIVVVGFGADLPQLLPTSRILHISQPAHAVRDLGEHLLELHQDPDAHPSPYLILCAAPLNADIAFQMAEALDKASAPVALVAPADRATHFPDAIILDASRTDAQDLDACATSIRLQSLDHAAYQQIVTALAVSGQAPNPAEGAWKHVPDDHSEPSTPRPVPAQCAPSDVPAAHEDPSTPATGPSSTAYPALLAASHDPTSPTVLTTPAAAAGTTPAADNPAATAPPQPALAVAEQETETDRDAPTPEIRILGPVEVTGVASAGHGPRQAQLAALLYFKPGRSADALCSDMDPINPWARDTLSARLQGLRRSLGNAPDGTPYVPRRQSASDPYQISPRVSSDWSAFVRLAQDALPQGAAGLPALENALSLIRGKPFGGHPLPWAQPLQQEMTSRITDVAHTVATLRTAPGSAQDLSAARQAIAAALEVDESAELLYRDWLKVEAAAGNRPGVHTAIARLQQVNRSIDADLEPETEQLIATLLNPSADRASLR
ncbi:hypothetical protein AB0M87_31510 [Streptomyces sp. NPDC051320]|uniref:hypothetical protein n=1 Tax=Streptomyces sp. NPDC051320 TaxID=3154644 RepID=UPI0034176B9B